MKKQEEQVMKAIADTCNSYQTEIVISLFILVT